MGKPPPNLPSRIGNSKRTAASSNSSVQRVTRRVTSSRDSNSDALRLQRYTSPKNSTRSQPATTRTTISRGFELGELSADDPVLTATKSTKNKGAAKTLTAKEKRQATIAAAEENAARLKKTRAQWGESDDEDSTEEEVSSTRRPTTSSSHRLTGGTLPVVTAVPLPEDADVEDSDEAPEASRRPRLANSRRFESDEDKDNDEYDHGGSGLENHDSDDDDPANSPTRTRRKVKSGTKFTSPTVTAVASKLPSKRVSGIKKAPRDPSVRSSSPPRRSSSSVSPQTPRKTQATRPRRCDQTPATSGLIQAASAEVRQVLILQDAFPDRTTFLEQCKAIYLGMCATYQATVQSKRFQRSDTYRKIVLDLLKQKLSQVRQEVRIAALSKTALHYGITSSMPVPDVVALVNSLKLKMGYVFGDTERYKSPYGNSLIQTIINSLFFEGKRKSDAIANPAPWNPMPLPIIALVATGIHSVLDDWSTGRNESAKNKFSHDNYESIYRVHLANLIKFQEKAPRALANLRITLWQNAWSSTNSTLPDEITVTIDDDVFAAAEDDALA
ncbi:hypothetical protein FRB90_000577 [Tulasnella sp. 427]|nr:hypothetical protein FRB90_000577 [Tulasnella sp. 427]